MTTLTKKQRQGCWHLFLSSFFFGALFEMLLCGHYKLTWLFFLIVLVNAWGAWTHLTDTTNP